MQNCGNLQAQTCVIYQQVHFRYLKINVIVPITAILFCEQENSTKTWKTEYIGMFT